MRRALAACFAVMVAVGAGLAFLAFGIVPAVAAGLLTAGFEGFVGLYVYTYLAGGLSESPRRPPS